MFVRRSKIPAGQFAVALAVVIGVGLSAGEAGANRDALPTAYFSLASYQANADTVANASVSRLKTSEGQTTAQPRKDRYRARNFTVLNYERELKLRNEAVIVRMKSPGKRNALVSLEFSF